MAIDGREQPTGMRAFIIVWLGQLVSLFGTALTQFALTIWAWELTGEATALALVGVFTFGPTVILSPVAGALVDRWNRKFVMMVSDIGAGISTLILLILFSADSLEIWHIYITGAFAGATQAFQFPAYSAAVTLMLPKEHYARASAMLAMAQSASGIFAPAVAATLLVFIGIGGIMTIDIITVTVAVLALLFVYIPLPEVTPETKAQQGNLLKETAFGFRYILQRPSLLGVQMVFFTLNLFGTIGFILLPAMILARTGGDGVSLDNILSAPIALADSSNGEIILGAVQSMLALGGLIGGLWISVWGGPKRRIHGVLIGMVFSSLFGQVLVGASQAPLVWAISSFVGSIAIAVLNASNQALWQTKVAPDVQGRVFAVRMWIAQITIPFSMLLGGILADNIFEPAMMPDGALADTFGGLVGTGAGAGMSLIFVITGVLGILAAIGAYFIPAIRNAETLIPDHDSTTAVDKPLPDGEPVPA